MSHIGWRLACSVAALTAGGALSAPALAQTIDAARGPISAGTRRLGLGGAFVAIAEDTDGVASNPASVAVRLPFSFHDWDYSLGLHVAVSSWLPGNDLLNSSGTSSEVSESSAIFGTMTAIGYYKHFGFGAAAEAQSNEATRQDRAQGLEPTDLTANFGALHASIAYGFLDGQLLLGAGPRLAGISFDPETSGSGPLSAAGVGGEVGVIVKPLGTQFRAGVAFRSAISTSVPDPEVGSRAVHLPWELALGFAYQFGPRPLNVPLVTVGEPESGPDEAELLKRFLALPRRYLLVSGELALIEGGSGHVGLEQYWSDSAETGAAQPIISPRVGVESEVVPRILKLRAGSYYEPALAARSESRIHGTLGFDVRLWEWDIFGIHRPFGIWQFSLGADAARSYLNTSFSIGFWH